MHHCLRIRYTTVVRYDLLQNVAHRLPQFSTRGVEILWHENVLWTLCERSLKTFAEHSWESTDNIYRTFARNIRRRYCVRFFASTLLRRRPPSTPNTQSVKEYCVLTPYVKILIRRPTTVNTFSICTENYLIAFRRLIAGIFALYETRTKIQNLDP